jgi:hypothetical protein
MIQNFVHKEIILKSLADHGITQSQMHGLEK